MEEFLPWLYTRYIYPTRREHVLGAAMRWSSPFWSPTWSRRTGGTMPRAGSFLPSGLLLVSAPAWVWPRASDRTRINPPASVSGTVPCRRPGGGRHLPPGCRSQRQVPPPSPPSGPRSITWSAVLITSRLCSMTTTVSCPHPPAWSTSMSLCTSAVWRPVVGSSRI